MLRHYLWNALKFIYYRTKLSNIMRDGIVTVTDSIIKQTKNKQLYNA